jgi:hypothetical protein
MNCCLKKQAFMLLFIIRHSRLSGILLQNGIMQREEKIRKILDKPE